MLGLVRAKKKKPSDYPQVQFRVRAKTELERLEGLWTTVLEKLNRGLGDDETRTAKNQVLILALQRGLEELKRMTKSELIEQLERSEKESDRS